MERNAHRLTLHSPAKLSLPVPRQRFIDIDQLYLPFSLFFMTFHSHLRRFNHQATPNTSSTNIRQKRLKPKR